MQCLRQTDPSLGLCTARSWTTISLPSMGEDGAFCSLLASATPAPAHCRWPSRSVHQHEVHTPLQYPGFQTAEVVCRQGMATIPLILLALRPRSHCLLFSVFFPSLPEASIQSSPPSLQQKQKPLKGARAVQSLWAFLLTALAACVVRAISQLMEAQFLGRATPRSLLRAPLYPLRYPGLSTALSTMPLPVAQIFLEP